MSTRARLSGELQGAVRTSAFAKLALAQGALYLTDAVSPLGRTRMRSRASARKRDAWIKTAGLLIGVLGGMLVAGERRRRAQSGMGADQSTAAAGAARKAEETDVERERRTGAATTSEPAQPEDTARQEHQGPTEPRAHAEQRRRGEPGARTDEEARRGKGGKGGKGVRPVDALSTGSPVGRGGSLLPHELPERVDAASDESFPASDPPGWTPSRVG